MKFRLADGSVYEENNEYWVKAIRMKKREHKDWGAKFVEVVGWHWKNKTVPTKFGSEISWTKNYKNQAALAPEVLYVYIRAILMGFLMNSQGGGKVIAIGKDGLVEYPSGKKVKKIG